MTSTNGDDYMFRRVHQDSVRLVVQHWLWTHRLRYALHNMIPKQTEHLRIADIGTANAVWILELLPLMPPTTQFDGFDISADYFPAKEWLPANVSLDVVDAFAAVPEHLVGKYDVVHIRAFVVIVRNNDPMRLLSNLIKMLKPGGYLQWDEMDFNTLYPSGANPSTPKAAAEKFVGVWKRELLKSDITFDWIPKLESSFREHGLSNVDGKRFPPLDQQRKIFTDDVLMGVENMLVAFSAKEKEASGLDITPQWQEACKQAVMESKQGMCLACDLISVVGQKPL